jgi:hypothetical protein
MLAKALGLRERTGVASEDHMEWAVMRFWLGNEVSIDGHADLMIEMMIMK